jgi:hypothetical protein
LNFVPRETNRTQLKQEVSPLPALKGRGRGLFPLKFFHHKRHCGKGLAEEIRISGADFTIVLQGGKLNKLPEFTGVDQLSLCLQKVFLRSKLERNVTATQLDTFQNDGANDIEIKFLEEKTMTDVVVTLRCGTLGQGQYFFGDMGIQKTKLSGSDTEAIVIYGIVLFTHLLGIATVPPSYVQMVVLTLQLHKVPSVGLAGNVHALDSATIEQVLHSLGIACANSLFVYKNTVKRPEVIGN